MLLDLRELAEPQSFDAPVCVVGAGVAGIALARSLMGLPGVDFTARTAIGSLGYYIAQGNEQGRPFAPMNANFGIMEPLEMKVKGGGRARHQALAARALAKIDEIRLSIDEQEATHGF